MKWECDRCGQRHNKNPSECKNCSYTVLTPKGTAGKTSNKNKVMLVLIALIILILLIIALI